MHFRPADATTGWTNAEADKLKTSSMHHPSANRQPRQRRQ
jgi:hypothetical protein